LWEWLKKTGLAAMLGPLFLPKYKFTTWAMPIVEGGDLMIRKNLVNIIGIVILVIIAVVSTMIFTNDYNYVEPDVVYEFTNKNIDWD